LRQQIEGIPCYQVPAERRPLGSTDRQAFEFSLAEIVFTAERTKLENKSRACRASVVMLPVVG